MRARAVTFIIVRLDARQRLLVLLRVHEQLKKELRKGSPNAQIPWLTVACVVFPAAIGPSNAIYG